MVDVEALPPHTHPACLDLVADPRIDQDGLRDLARSPYSFVRLAVAKDIRTNAATLTLIELLAAGTSNSRRSDSGGVRIGLRYRVVD